MPGTIRDPRMNPSKESDFGVLLDDSTDILHLYYKGSLDDPNNPKRYFTAGTVVEYTDGPKELTKKTFPFKVGKVKIDKPHINIETWVEIENEPSGGTGEVVQQINTLVKGKISFGDKGDKLENYTTITITD